MSQAFEFLFEKMADAQVDFFFLKWERFDTNGTGISSTMSGIQANFH